MNEFKKKLPRFIKIRPPESKAYYKVRDHLNSLNLNTVCKEAKCPNTAECWSMGTATIMLLGDTCTRACRFCNVKTGNPNGYVDMDEPNRVSDQISQTDLTYIVLTCVDRDDLPDGGAWIFAETIRQIKNKKADIRVEGLISDYAGSTESLELLINAKPDVLAHNIETISRLTPSVRDKRASYEQSLGVLKKIKELSPNTLTKSSIMVGLGETMDEIEEVTDDLRSAGVDIVTYGQYLRPSLKHLEVQRFYPPSDFKKIELYARSTGFIYVASGPLVRSSYKAGELFTEKYLKERANS